MREEACTAQVTFDLPVAAQHARREAPMRTPREKPVCHPQWDKRAEPRWLLAILFVLVALCVLLGVVVWWHLLSAPLF